MLLPKKKPITEITKEFLMMIMMISFSYHQFSLQYKKVIHISSSHTITPLTPNDGAADEAVIDINSSFCFL